MSKHLWSMKACRSSKVFRDGSTSAGGLKWGTRLSSRTADSKIDTCEQQQHMSALASKHLNSEFFLPVETPEPLPPHPIVLPQPDLPGACRSTHQSLHVLIAACSIRMPPDGLQAQQPHSILQPPQRNQPVHHLRATTCVGARFKQRQIIACRSPAAPLASSSWPASCSSHPACATAILSLGRLT